MVQPRAGRVAAYDPHIPAPTIIPLGDSALLVRFGDRLTDAANRAAIALERLLDADPVPGVVETCPNLVSVLLRYDPMRADPGAIAGEVRLRLVRLKAGDEGQGRAWTIPVRFDGEDLSEVAALAGLPIEDFIAAHNRRPLRVLATGFAPGFVYCGLHEAELVVPRRTAIRPAVPPGTILFAAGQTAITATEMPTGWHVIGHTDFRNFDPDAAIPTRLRAGDAVTFVEAR